MQIQVSLWDRGKARLQYFALAVHTVGYGVRA